MLFYLLHHIKTGSIESHKQAMKYWIQRDSHREADNRGKLLSIKKELSLPDVTINTDNSLENTNIHGNSDLKTQKNSDTINSPIEKTQLEHKNTNHIEFFMGFLDSYNDPLHNRGNWEAFVGIDATEVPPIIWKITSHISDIAHEFPWGNEYNNKNAINPQLIPVNIINYIAHNIPVVKTFSTYEDITYSCDNYPLSISSSSIEYYSHGDPEQIKPDFQDIIIIDTCLRELFGHMTSTCIYEQTLLDLYKEHISEEMDSDCTDNEVLTIDTISVLIINPLTNKPIDSWYKSSQTYISVFKDISILFEELRSMALSLYLLFTPTLHSILYIYPNSYHVYLFNRFSYLFEQVIKSLKNFKQESETWSDAHSQAVFCLFNYLNRSIPTLFVTVLKIYKACAMVLQANDFIGYYSRVSNDYLQYIYIASKQKSIPVVILQDTIIEQDDDYVIVSPDPSLEGYINMFVNNYTQTT
ncbi:hypothetical protein WA158_006594 [Blastocystis sp. Blastoise]